VLKVVLAAVGPAFVGAEPGRDDPELLSFINFLNESHGMFGIVHDAAGFSVELELGDAPLGTRHKAGKRGVARRSRGPFRRRAGRRATPRRPGFS
jgi:hypothetical protein